MKNSATFPRKRQRIVLKEDCLKYDSLVGALFFCFSYSKNLEIN